MTSSWEGKSRWPGVVLGKIKSLWSTSQGTASDGLNQLIDPPRSSKADGLNRLVNSPRKAKYLGLEHFNRPTGRMILTTACCTGFHFVCFSIIYLHIDLSLKETKQKKQIDVKLILSISINSNFDAKEIIKLNGGIFIPQKEENLMINDYLLATSQIKFALKGTAQFPA